MLLSNSSCATLGSGHARPVLDTLAIGGRCTNSTATRASFLCSLSLTLWLVMPKVTRWLKVAFRDSHFRIIGKALVAARSCNIGEL